MLQVTGKRAKFDVLLTSYEILLGATDRPRLAGLQWSYVIVDEVPFIQLSADQVAILRCSLHNHRLKKYEGHVYYFTV